MSTDSNDNWRVDITPAYGCGTCDWEGTSTDLRREPYPVCPDCGGAVYVNR